MNDYAKRIQTVNTFVSGFVRKNVLLVTLWTALLVMLVGIAVSSLFGAKSAQDNNLSLESTQTTAVDFPNATDINNKDLPDTDLTGKPKYGEHADEVKAPAGPKVESLADKEVTLLVTLDAPSASELLPDPNGTPEDIKNIDKVENDVKTGQNDIINQIATITGELPTQQYSYLVNALQIATTADKIEQILALPGVAGAQEERLYKPADSTANEDSGVDNVWSGDGYGTDGATGGTGYRGEGQVIAIVDSGVDADHRDFCISKSTQPKYSRAKWQEKITALGYGTWKNDKIPFGFNYSDHSGADQWLRADDDEYHGMHVAGLTAANGQCEGANPPSDDWFRTGDGSTLPDDHVSDYSQPGISNAVGVAPEAQIINMKVFSNTLWHGEGQGAYDSSIVHGIEDAVKLGADVINMSLGGVDGIDSPDVFLVNAVNSAARVGVIPAVAAGNSGTFSGLAAYGDDHSAFRTDEDSSHGAPGVGAGALAVASSENNTTVLDKMYLEPMFAGQTASHYTDYPSGLTHFTGCFTPRTGELKRDTTPLSLNAAIDINSVPVNCSDIQNPVTDYYGNTENIKSISQADAIDGKFSKSFKKFFANPKLCEPNLSGAQWEAEKVRCGSTSDTASTTEDSDESRAGKGLQFYALPDQVSYSDGFNTWSNRYSDPSNPNSVKYKPTPIAEIANDGNGTTAEHAILPGWGFPDDYNAIECNKGQNSGGSLPQCDPYNFRESDVGRQITPVTGKIVLVTLSNYVRTQNAIDNAKAAGAKGIIFIQLEDDVKTTWGIEKEIFCDSHNDYITGDCFPVAMVDRPSGEKLYQIAIQSMANVYQTDVCSNNFSNEQSCANILDRPFNGVTPVLPTNLSKMTDKYGSYLTSGKKPNFLEYSYHPVFIDHQAVENRTVGRQPSDFTSWGPSPTLDFKPDIMAPGGNMWSTMNICTEKVDTLKSNLHNCENPNDSNYQLMSGTSMATPFMSGVMSLIVQHLKTTLYAGQSTVGNTQFQLDARTLAVNTAKPAISPTGVPYSPRRQGSGNVDVDDAVNSRVILRNAENAGTESNPGTFALHEINTPTRDLSVELQNITDKDATYIYDGDGYVLHQIRVDDIEAPFVGVKKSDTYAPFSQYDDREIIYNKYTEKINGTGNLELLQDAVVTGANITGPNTIIVSAGTTVHATFTLNLGQTPKQQFIEGFVKLNSNEPAKYPSVGFAYMGYYGDFDADNIVDKPATQTSTPVNDNYDGSIFADTALYDGYTSLLGAKYAEKDFFVNTNAGSPYWLNLQTVLPDNVAIHSTDIIAGDTQYGTVVPAVRLKRYAAIIKPRIVDASGKVYKEFITVYDVPKGQQLMFSEWMSDGKWLNPATGKTEPLPEGQYYYEVLAATLNDTTAFQSTKLPFKVDNTPPSASNMDVKVGAEGTPDIDTNFNDGTLVDNNPPVHVTGTMVDLQSGVDTSNHVGAFRINNANTRPNHLEELYLKSGQPQLDFDFKLDKWQKSSLVNGVNQFWLTVYDYAGNASEYNFQVNLGTGAQGSPLFGNFALDLPGIPQESFVNPKDAMNVYTKPSVKIKGRSSGTFYVYVTKWDQAAFESDVITASGSADLRYSSFEDIDWHQQLDRVVAVQVDASSGYTFDQDIPTPQSTGSFVYCATQPTISDPTDPDFKKQTCGNVLSSPTFYKINPLKVDFGNLKAKFSDPRTNFDTEEFAKDVTKVPSGDTGSQGLSLSYVNWSELPKNSEEQKILTINAHLEQTELPVIAVCFNYKKMERTYFQNVCKAATSPSGDYSLDIDMTPTPGQEALAKLAVIEPDYYSFEFHAFPLIDTTRSLIRFDTAGYNGGIDTYTISPYANMQTFSVAQPFISNNPTDADPNGSFPTPYPASEPASGDNWDFLTPQWNSWLAWTNMIGQTDSNYFPQDGKWHQGYWWDTTETGVRQKSDDLSTAFLSPITTTIPAWGNLPHESVLDTEHPHAMARDGFMNASIYVGDSYYSETFNLAEATDNKPTAPDWRTIVAGNDSSNGICSDSDYTTKQKCVLAGGVWTPNDHCNIPDIETQVNCEAAGGVWTNDEKIEQQSAYDLDGDGYITFDEVNEYSYTPPDIIQNDAVLIAGKNSIQSLLLNNYGLKKFGWNPKTHEVTLPIQAGPAVCKLTLNTTGFRDPAPGTPNSEIVLIDRTTTAKQTQYHPELHAADLDKDACTGADTPDPSDDMREPDAERRPTGVALSSLTFSTDLLDMQNWYLTVTLDQGPDWQTTCQYFMENPENTHLNAAGNIEHDTCPSTGRYYTADQPYSATFVAIGKTPDVATDQLDETVQTNAHLTQFDPNEKLQQFSDDCVICTLSMPLATQVTKEPLRSFDDLGKSLTPLASDPIEGAGTNEGDSTLLGFLRERSVTSPLDGAKALDDTPYKEYTVTTTDATFDLSGLSTHPLNNQIIYVNSVPTVADLSLRTNAFDIATLYGQQFKPEGFTTPYSMSLPLQAPTDANPQTVNHFVIEYADDYNNEVQLRLDVIRQLPGYDANCPAGNCSNLNLLSGNGSIANTGVSVILLILLLLGLAISGGMMRMKKREVI